MLTIVTCPCARHCDAGCRMLLGTPVSMSRAVVMLPSRILLPQSLDRCSSLDAPLRELDRPLHSSAGTAPNAVGAHQRPTATARLVRCLLRLLEQLIHLELQLGLDLVVPRLVRRCALAYKLAQCPLSSI